MTTLQTAGQAMEALELFTIGQEVRLRVHAWSPPTGESPGGLYGSRGDKLIVKAIGPATFTFPISVHHPDVKDGSSFGVRADEIEPWTAIDAAISKEQNNG